MDDFDSATSGNSDKKLEITLGLQVRALNAEERKKANLNDGEGVMVTAVQPGGTAAEAGVRDGDILLFLGKARITSPSELKRLTEKLEPGKTVVVRVQRDGRSLFLTLDIPGSE